MKSSPPEQQMGGHSLLLIALFVFFGLLLKNSGLYPFIFGDEFTYSLYSRLQPLSESMIPGYLYLAVYRLSNHCATDFLGCARIFNAFFFVCAAPFVYQVARRVMTVLPALIITLCALLAPINVYTAHYMPEAFYFFGFWAFIWALTKVRTEEWQDWALAGFILGCTALIKPHSMLFIPALIIYIGYVSLSTGPGRVVLTLRNLAAFLLAAIVAKFAISFLLAGPAGLTLFGPSYNKIASGVTGVERLVQLIAVGLASIKGHVLALCLTLGLTLAVTLQLSFKAIIARRPPDDTHKIAILAALLIANLVAVVGLFTASVVSTSIYESVTRMHVRYYDFAFPLLWIVVAALLNNQTERNEPRRWRLLLSLAIGLPMLYAIVTQMAPFEPSIVDSPELRGFLFDPASFYLMSGLGLVALCAWVYRPRIGAGVFVYVALPITVVLSSYWVTKEQRLHLIPDVYDRAGIFTRDYLSPQERAQTLILGADLGGLMKASFHIENPTIWPFIITDKDGYDFQGLPDDKQWLLSIGHYVPFADGRLQVRMPGFTLTRIKQQFATGTVDFRQNQWPGLLAHTQGLAAPENWGTWSMADNVTLTFADPLPKTVTLRLTANAFGPNIGKDFILRVGHDSVAFTLTEHLQEQRFTLENPDADNEIKIVVPDATSPKALGMNEDQRKLGIALRQLVIEGQELKPADALINR